MDYSFYSVITGMNVVFLHKITETNILGQVTPVNMHFYFLVNKNVNLLQN